MENVRWLNCCLPLCSQWWGYLPSCPSKGRCRRHERRGVGRWGLPGLHLLLSPSVTGCNLQYQLEYRCKPPAGCCWHPHWPCGEKCWTYHVRLGNLHRNWLRYIRRSCKIWVRHNGVPKHRGRRNKHCLCAHSVQSQNQDIQCTETWCLRLGPNNRQL